MTYTPQKMLVTGSAGFIGSHFVRQQLAHYPDLVIIGLDKLTYAGNLKNLEYLPNAHQYIFVQGDIGDTALLRELFKKYHIDTVVHFAAESHVDRSIENPRAFIDTNIVGTFELLQQAKENRCRFHHISTDEVYGSLEKNAQPFSETHAYQPNSPYAASKAGSDHMVRAFMHTYGLSATISNCSNNYGPYQHAEKLIPTVISACLQKKPIPIYGDGSNIRDWIYVTDHCDAIDLILRHGELHQTYNIGGQCELSNLVLVKTICQLMDQRFPIDAPHEKHIKFVTDRLGHDWRYAIDHQKIQRALSWKPTTLLTAGLAKTIDFYSELLTCLN